MINNKLINRGGPIKYFFSFSSNHLTNSDESNIFITKCNINITLSLKTRRNKVNNDFLIFVPDIILLVLFIIISGCGGGNH